MMNTTRNRSVCQCLDYHRVSPGLAAAPKHRLFHFI